jgi:hypothetical protein
VKQVKVSSLAFHISPSVLFLLLKEPSRPGGYPIPRLLLRMAIEIRNMANQKSNKLETRQVPRSLSVQQLLANKSIVSVSQVSSRLL